MTQGSHIEKFTPVAHVNRINNQVRRRRQAWLDLPAHEIEEVGHGQDCAGTIGQGCAEAPGVRGEGIAAQGQAWNRAGHGANPEARPSADHQRGATDRHHEDGLDGRQRTLDLLELSAPRNRD